MLALVGSGEYLPAMEPVDRELISRLQEPPRVVCLPTAAGKEGPGRISYWSRLGVDHFTRLEARVEALPVIDRSSANDKALANAIAGANFVYLSGGKPDYLYKTLAGSLTWEAVLSVLDGGGLLAGCSAGAMILGEKFLGFPGWKSGFNFLPGMTIIPHYDQFPEYVIKSIRPFAGRNLTVLGIEGNTTLLHSGEQYEVLGSGGIIVWNRVGKTRYTRGPLPADVLGKHKNNNGQT
jgi:cyanophycinase-like exopeptidase